MRQQPSQKSQMTSLIFVMILWIALLIWTGYNTVMLYQKGGTGDWHMWVSAAIFLWSCFELGRDGVRIQALRRQK
ncbi:hypothetical protein ACRYI5_06475 [Furfurilactobacillus sp. WILCCON 0119]|uniref:hypothetical protein n=1 Tax=Furfurilactobacillus entadae TaxID=2922307 RepID=UPI0035E8976E